MVGSPDTLSGTCVIPDTAPAGSRARGRAEGPPAISSWADEEKRLRATASCQGITAALARLKALIAAHPAATDVYLLAGRFLLELDAHKEALGMFLRVRRLALPGTLNRHHPDTAGFVLAQLEAGTTGLPAHLRAEENLSRNLSALAEADPEAAQEVIRASDPPDTRIIELWDRLVIANPRTRRVALEADTFLKESSVSSSPRRAFGFFGCGSGQEILLLLRNPPRSSLERIRIVYLLERDASLLKNFLRLEDISQALRDHRLVVFGGEGWARSLERTFSTCRYPAPEAFIGDKTPYMPGCGRIQEHISADLEKEASAGYYASETFKARLSRIAAGTERPRILLLTGRWTTVLKYVCTDFQRGFEDQGCPTELLVEESDVETLAHGCHFKALDRFRPDMVFSVSHGRPTFPFLPRELPAVCFYMDRCEPIVDLPRLDDRVAPSDLFFCMLDRFIGYLAGKGIAPGQLHLMATPGDDRVFRPLDPHSPLLERYAADVSWVKHGGPDPSQTFRQFLSLILGQGGDPFQPLVTKAFESMHGKVMADRSRLFIEKEVLDLVLGQLPAGFAQEQLDAVRGLVTRYMVSVFSLSWRQHFLEPLAESGLRLRLFGSGWDLHPLFSRFAGGVVPHGEPLNGVFNASRINLHIHDLGAMHQRLAEGALAGGFFLANRLDPSTGFEPIDPYFEEGREVVSFASAHELLEKCRHYLDHGDERRAIADRMRSRALRELTSRAAAGRALSVFRERLKAVGG